MAYNAKIRLEVSRKVHQGRLQPADGCAEESPLSAGRTLSLPLWYCTYEQSASQLLALPRQHQATGETRAGKHHHVTDLPRGDAAAWLVVTQDDAGGVAPPSRRPHHPEEPCSLA